VPGWTDLADDLIAVLDRLDLADAHLVGYSWGAQIVLRAALDHSGRVDRLSIVCSPAAPFPSFHAVAAGLRAGTADRAGSLARWFDPDELSRLDPLVADVRARLEDADTEAWVRALDMIADLDVLDELSRIEVPVDVVAASHDGVGDPGHMARIAAGVLHGELHVVAGAHHLLPLQRPDLVAAALKMR
jgi:3-oxoadipate enol-lactonase